MDVDLEIGGNDQMFNMMRGRDLQKVINDREKFVLTLKILADDGGKKMGKSEGNAIFLDQKSEDIYGVVMSWPDGFIANTFELITDKPLAEIEEIRKQIAVESVNPRDLKMQLALELVKIFHGKDKAEKAQQAFVEQFQKKGIPEDTEVVKIKNKEILDILVETGLSDSKSEARRKIEEGAVKINDEKVEDSKKEIILEGGEELILKLGRKIVKVCR